jgi:DNA-binding response OmpR family regulator
VPVADEKPSILHVCVRETILGLRDQILRLQGYEVVSTLSLDEALTLFRGREYSLVLIDVEGEGRIPHAEELCVAIKHDVPGQKVAFVCNHRVAIHSSCPNDVIRSEFNPLALVQGVKDVLESNHG